MIYRLKQTEFFHVLPLVEDVQHALIVRAVAEGSAPGWIVVDDPGSPKTLFASTPEGYYLLGESTNRDFNRGLGELITGKILPGGKSDGWAVFYLHHHPDSWAEWLDESLGDLGPVKDYQRYFRFRELKFNWHDRIPAGFSVRRVDQTLLSQSYLKNIEALKRQANSNFGSIDGYLDNGFGFCLLHGDEIVCWCMSDCVSGDSCEVGIRTDTAYRRRGFATITVAATIEHCLSKGLTQIGWHCWSSNLASAATALGVGFEEVLEHHAFIVWLRKVDGMLVNGNLKLMQHRFAEAASYYEQAFQLMILPGEESFLLGSAVEKQLYYYHAACAWALAGEKAASLETLEKALEIGGFRQGGY
ncbi:MAG: GNAT family N-acetyltransferase [Candidatus Promineifilaceae bacterium]